jgi:hypothetical protein
MAGTTGSSDPSSTTTTSKADRSSVWAANDSKHDRNSSGRLWVATSTLMRGGTLGSVRVKRTASPSAARAQTLTTSAAGLPGSAIGSGVRNPMVTWSDSTTGPIGSAPRRTDRTGNGVTRPTSRATVPRFRSVIGGPAAGPLWCAGCNRSARKCSCVEMSSSRNRAGRMARSSIVTV